MQDKKKTQLDLQKRLITSHGQIFYQRAYTILTFLYNTTVTKQDFQQHSNFKIQEMLH